MSKPEEMQNVVSITYYGGRRGGNTVSMQWLSDKHNLPQIIRFSPGGDDKMIVASLQEDCGMVIQLMEIVTGHRFKLFREDHKNELTVWYREDYAKSLASSKK